MASTLFSGRSPYEGRSIVEKFFALEGLLPDFEDRWKDPERRAQLLDVLRLAENDPSIVGASHHVLAVAHKNS